LVARKAGIEVKKIILLPIGGMAVMGEKKLGAFDEFKMAIAGPMFNFAFCALLAVLITALQLPVYSLDAWNAALEPGAKFALLPLLLSSYFWLNWMLGTFNLFLPAIPLDGGRVFRSVLAMVMGYVDATRLAANVSKVVTVFLFLFAFFTGNLILVAISVFIYLGSTAELEFALSNELLAGVPVKRVLRKNFLVVDYDDAIADVVGDMIASKSLVAFIAMDGHVGVASLYDLRHVPKSKWANVGIGKVAHKVRPINSAHSIMDALKRMNAEQLEALPVVERKGIIGVVFRDDIAKVFEILKVASE
jgi:Zn-dependent protease